LEQPTKHVRTHTHKLKPLSHFTVVPQPLSPLRFQHHVIWRLLREKWPPPTNRIAANTRVHEQNNADNALIQ